MADVESSPEEVIKVSTEDDIAGTELAARRFDLLIYGREKT